MASPQGRMVFATLTNEFVNERAEENVAETEMLERWMSLRMNKEVLPHREHLEDTDSFQDHINANEKADPEHAKPLLHAMWSQPARTNATLSHCFNNGATYRALAFMATGNISQAV